MLTRRAMLSSVSCLAVAPAVMAQGPGGRRPRGGGPMNGERQVEMMKERLNLSAEQEEKIKAIFEERGEKMAKARDESGDDRSAMRETMGKIFRETDEKVIAVLNDEQKEEYKKMQEEMRERMRQRGGQRRGGPPQQ